MSQKVKSKYLQTKVLIPKMRNLWLAVPNSLSNTLNVKEALYIFSVSTSDYNKILSS